MSETSVQNIGYCVKAYLIKKKKGKDANFFTSQFAKLKMPLQFLTVLLKCLVSAVSEHGNNGV